MCTVHYARKYIVLIAALMYLPLNGHVSVGADSEMPLLSCRHIQALGRRWALATEMSN